ncbi:MAG: fatty acyl-AMP ligase [Planctomycetes bacterium]|nr:fatty acyl-AMP ligase [Planctomycetota bacterium]
MSDHGPHSLVDLLHNRSLEMHDTQAFTFLADGVTEAESLTYGELDRRSRAIAFMLQRRHAAGERALLLYPPGLDFIAAFFGCLYAGVIAVPVFPPRPARRMRGLERCRAIARDADITIVLGTERFVEMIDEIIRQVPELAEARWLSTESVPPGDADYWRKPAVDHDRLALLQYTSGSTATPKGVMVSHGNLMHNLAYAHHCAENDAHSVSVSWLPVYHDMGLVNGVLLPVYGGYRSYLMAPAAFLQKPLRWLNAITRYGATNSGGPNFAYELCVRSVRRKERRQLDLSTWRVAYNGAEPIRWKTLKRFYEVFRENGFKWRHHYPVYGLAEATVLVSSGRQSYEPRAIRLDAAKLAVDVAVETRETGADSITVPSCGPFSCRTRIVIAHPDSCEPCGPGEVGEIWVRSPSVALGYWNRPEETRQTFHAYLAGSDEGPFLRTGDLGFLSRGELVVTGRIKELIIVRGRKHYPQDIEHSVEECHDAVRAGCVAAFSFDEDGGEELAVVAEVDRRQLRSGSVLDAILAAVRQTVTEQHGLQLKRAVLLRPGHIPKTSSGKLRRHACRKALRADGLKLIAQWVQAPRVVKGVGT